MRSASDRCCRSCDTDTDYPPCISVLSQCIRLPTVPARDDQWFSVFSYLAFSFQFLSFFCIQTLYQIHHFVTFWSHRSFWPFEDVNISFHFISFSLSLIGLAGHLKTYIHGWHGMHATFLLGNPFSCVFDFQFTHSSFFLIDLSYLSQML